MVKPWWAIFRMVEADFSLGTTLFRLGPSIRTRQRGRSSLTVHTRLVRTEAPRHSASKVGMKLDNFENRSSFRGCEIVRPPRESTKLSRRNLTFASNRLTNSLAETIFYRIKMCAWSRF